MTDRPFADRLADVVIFAPLGLALTALERIPVLAATGRQVVESRLATARFVGELAVKQAGRLGDQLVTKNAKVAPRLAPDAPALAATSPDLAAVSPPPAPALPALASDAVPSNASLAAAALAIPGYDTLSAFQVVQRLEGLSPDELEQVRNHEQVGRRRQTILNRIAQLSAAS